MLLGALATMGTTGCDSLAAPDYTGNALVSLKGVASSGSTDGQVTRSGILGAALWQGTSYRGSIGYSRLGLRLEFPEFWIDILSKPTADQMFVLAQGEPTIAEGYLHIVSDSETAPQADNIVATDFEHALVYVSAPLPPVSAAAQYLGGVTTPGFHVMIRTPIETLTPAGQLMVQRCMESAPQLSRQEAQDTCTAQHLYRLDVADGDLGTTLDFTVEGTPPR